MLKLRHKILPVLLDDLSDVKVDDENLAYILQTVTYIKWPGEKDKKAVDKFWKDLERSLSS